MTKIQQPVHHANTVAPTFPSADQTSVGRSDLKNAIQELQDKLREGHQSDVHELVANVKKQIGALKQEHGQRMETLKAKTSPDRLASTKVRSNFQSNFQVLHDQVRMLRGTVAGIRKEYGRPVIDPRGA